MWKDETTDFLHDEEKLESRTTTGNGKSIMGTCHSLSPASCPSTASVGDCRSKRSTETKASSTRSSSKSSSKSSLTCSLNLDSFALRNSFNVSSLALDESTTGSPWIDQGRSVLWQDAQEREQKEVQDPKNQKKMTTDCMRVRVINQRSKCYKDLLVEIRNDFNLFGAIYNNKGVKKANCRKWCTSTTQLVKASSHEIRCAVWDDVVNSPCHTYSIEELKQTSTRQLYQLVGPESDLIKLVLQCVEKTSYLRSSEIPIGNGNDSPTTKIDVGTTSRFNHPPLLSGNGIFRCPFSGIAINESIILDLVEDQNSNKDMAPPRPSNNRNQPFPGNDTISDYDDNDNSTIRTDTVRPLNDTLSIKSMNTQTTMRIKISNKSTKRYKDLVVDIKTDVFLFESVYENSAVKSAQVRKWKPDVVRDVKKTIAEIQCVVLDGSADQNAVQSYSLEDLKTISTSDLFDLAQGNDPVQLVLQCIKKHSVCGEVEKKLIGIDLPRASLKLQKDLPHAATPNYKSRSEPSIAKLPVSTRRSSRPNHMNLSGVVNASFGTTGHTSNRSISYIDYNSNSMVATDGGTTASDDKSLTKSSGSRTRSESFSLGNHLPKFSPYKITPLTNREPKNKNYPEQDGSDTKSCKNDLSSTSNPNFQQSRVLADPVPLIIHPLQKKKPILFSASHSVPLLDAESGKSRTPRRSSASDIVCSTRIHKDKISEFRRLCRSKKGLKQQSGESLHKLETTSNVGPASLVGTKNATFQLESNSPTPKSSKMIKGTYKINRFLQFGASRNVPFEGPTNESNPFSFTKSPPNEAQAKNQINSKKNVPPVSEINVIKGSSNLEPPPENTPNISLSGDLVKEVFPYHIVINEDFRILQVGNSLSILVDDGEIIGRCISDILMITGPIPSFGNWNWSILDKMKDKTIFLEGVREKCFNQKAKIKGTIIELSNGPERQILLALFPNVKNLSELESMNLSMTDLPIHSCQREAVLLGEHSKSEVKLTNHLDLLHRELIDSMEKQIKDRTNELATANINLEKANAQLAIQSAKQLEHFACMSHEIRTPLNCIVGMSSLLLEDDGPSMDPMHADSIRMINTSGELLSAVVDDVLDYAKLESGSFEVDIGLTKLQDTLDSVLYSITQKMQEKNIRIRTHFSPTVPEIIETDSRRLQQVLFNLLGNAGKFSKIDSVIDLSVSLVKATSTNGTNGDNERRDIIRFSVKDYGKGIDKKDFETIFQPFSQASKETQNVYGGTGLGLSITSKLVHRLGGKISLDSELGKFADFTFDLPMNGKYVDIQKISDCLKNATIILIEPKQVYDYSFTPFPIREESLPLGPAVIEVFGLNIIRCNTLKELNGKISARNDNRLHEHFTLLVHETLHELCSSEQLDSILGQPKCYSLMTYGKNFLAEKTNACHFKSLTGLFPATLLEAITKQISTHKQMETISGPTSSKFATILQTPVTSNAKKFISKDGLSASHLTSKEKMTSALAKTTKNPGNITKVSIGKLDLKILYAEDNIVNQKVLARVLNRYGITDITIVDNGKKAVDISAKTKYDCILLDMQMPIMGGIEACELIMDRDPDSKIVFVTAHALDEFKVKAKSVGAIGFISKPFRVGDIDEVLKEIYM